MFSRLFYGISLGLAIATSLFLSSYSASQVYVCPRQEYSTEVLSVDPLVIYINDFVTENEIQYLMKLGLPLFSDSELYNDAQDRSVDKPYRSSSTAFLPVGDEVCHCIGKRALAFQGFVEHEAYEPLQLVRYYPGQKYNTHSDWLRRPKTSNHPFDKGRPFNRLASFFTYLGGNSTGGETFFPYVKGAPESADGHKYSRSQSGEGLIVKPKRGNALFWLNLHTSNGTGDERTYHAGLPIHSGVKYGMNVWTKHYEGSTIHGPYESAEGDLADLLLD